jgi:hypothetical protein
LNESKSEYQLLQQEILDRRKMRKIRNCDVVEMKYELKEQSETISRLVQSLVESRIFCDVVCDDDNDSGNTLAVVQNINIK